MSTEDETVQENASRKGATHRPFVLTDMPTWLMLLLVAIGMPRTILADLNVVPPESGILYYILALAPFVAWIAVAIVRETRKPIMDFIVLGVLYGLSLILVHQVLWNTGVGEGKYPTQGALNFADNFSPSVHDLAMRGFSVMIALAIGIGSGIIVALIAFVAKLVRSRRQKA